jgi:hypothetical protein
MPIRVERFPVGKDTTLERLNRFLLQKQIGENDIISIDIARRGQDSLEYVLTYFDGAAPRIITTFPTDGQGGIAPGTSIIVTFSEPVQAMTTADVVIVNINDNITVAGTEYTIDNTSAGSGIIRINDPSGGTGPVYLIDQKTWRFTFQTTIRDLDGNTMEQSYDLVFSTSTSQSELDFDGDNAGGFSAEGLNQWATSVTPSRLSLIPTTNIQLTMQSALSEELAGLTPHVERTGSSFRIVLEHDNKLLSPEPTGVLPTGITVDWLAINGLG